MTFATVIVCEPGPVTSEAVAGGVIGVDDAVGTTVFVGGIGVAVGGTGVKPTVGDAVGVGVCVVAAGD